MYHANAALKMHIVRTGYGVWFFQPFTQWCSICWSVNFSGPLSAPTVSCDDLSEDVSGTVSVSVSWTLSGGDSADFYLIRIITNAPQTPYGGLLNITTASVTQHELTGFMAGYEYNITVRGVTSNCGGLVGRESEPLTITPEGNNTTGGSESSSLLLLSVWNLAEKIFVCLLLYILFCITSFLKTYSIRNLIKKTTSSFLHLFRSPLCLYPLLRWPRWRRH